MRHFLRSLIAIIALTALAACTSFGPIPRLWTTQSAKEKEIAALRVEYDTKVTLARTRAETAAEAVIAAKDAQMQGAAAALFGQDLVFRSLIIPTRTDLIQRNLSVEAWAALGGIAPTAEGMRQMAERIAKELDSTRTSLADLQINHAAALAQNQALAEAAKKHAAELAAAQERVTALEKERDQKIAAKQAELIEVQGRLIAAEHKRANDRAAIQAMKLRFSMIAGALALAGVAGVIWSPVFKQHLAIFAAVAGLVATGIWYLQGWHVALAAAVVVVGLIGWALLKHRKEERLADGLVLGLQRIKDQSRDTWAKVSPVIQDALGKYTKQGGKTVVVPDPAMEALVDTKLRDFEQLGADPQPRAEPTPVE